MRRSWLRLSLTAVTFLYLGLILIPAEAALQGGGRGRGGGRQLGPATEPSPPRTMDRHDAFLEIADAGNIDLLFVGDSITDGWDNGGAEVWNEYFVPLNVANFGIGGDTTQGVLWRMRNGELVGFEARLIVLMLGTNNINRNPNDEIVEGNRLIVEAFRQSQPDAKVLVLGVFPRGAEPDNPYRASIGEINSQLAEFADEESVFYMDIGQEFLTGNGTLTEEIMPDGLHPNARGYQIWADAIIGTVHSLMD